jgi:hypothetical protein
MGAVPAGGLSSQPTRLYGRLRRATDAPTAVNSDHSRGPEAPSYPRFGRTGWWVRPLRPGSIRVLGRLGGFCAVNG